MLSSKYNFEWFIYSGTIYFTSTQVVNRGVNVSGDAFSIIKSNLQQIGLFNDKFSYSEMPADNRIVVSGPTAYVDLVINQINSLKVSSDRQQYVVYRLKYANAVDTQLFFNKQTITIPGVVTILQNLASSKAGTGNIVSNVGELTQNSADGKTTKESANATATNATSSPSSSNTGNSANSNNSIQADPRTNSVILIGDQTRINIYKNLINKIDIPSILVQVDVVIIHLDQQALEQIGVNWSALLGSGVAMGSTTARSPIGGIIGAINPGDIFVANMKNFSVQLKALSSDGLAEVTSKPSLVTENNLPAILNVSETFYSSLANSNTSYGQLSNGLQITPHVIFEDKGQKLIRLSIVLDDGIQGQEDEAAGPTLIQSTLTSQAVINEGQSILLAGHSSNAKSKKETKVPGLGDIPVLGWLFRSTSTSVKKMTTLFLVTPRILWAPTEYKLGDNVIIDGRKIDTSSNNSKIIVTPTGN